MRVVARYIHHAFNTWELMGLNHPEYIRHKAHYDKWVKIYRSLCDSKDRTFKKTELALKIQKHMWKIEFRMLCYQWYGDEAKSKNLYPKSLK